MRRDTTRLRARQITNHGRHFVALNEAPQGQLLLGIAQDLQNGGTRSGMLEASMRFSNNLRIRLDAWFFQTMSLQQPTWWFRQDDYIQLGFDYYF